MTPAPSSTAPDTRGRILDSAERLFAAHGFDGIVPKPFTPLQLLDEVRRVLDGPPHAP